LAFSAKNKNKKHRQNFLRHMSSTFLSSAQFGLGTHLSVKVLRLGDFSVFESSCHLLLTSLTTQR